MVGKNAAGKTNLLEAIFLLATGKSFKAQNDAEMINFASEIARVKGEVLTSDDEKIVLEVVITQGEVMGVKTPKKKLSVNNVSKRKIDFAGKLKTTLFWPEDLELVLGSPARRRNYLDFVLIQLDREYHRTILSYERGLRQRNRLLEAVRDSGVNPSQLFFWNQLLIKSGSYITAKRQIFIDYLNHKYKLDTGGTDFSLPIYSLDYDKSLISADRIEQYKNEEIAAGNTLVGPHRDDFSFKLKNHTENLRDLSDFGSRGEQRLAVLWLKLGELAYIENMTETRPLLLLDDILSELDVQHRKLIFKLINNQQTIMTTIDLHKTEQKEIKGEIIEIT